MKKILFFISLFIFIVNVNANTLNSKYSYVYNVDLDKVMYEKDSNTKVPVASLTKIMTALIVIENNPDLNKEVTIINSDLKDRFEYAVAGFNVGEKFTINELLYGILLPSGSDAVNAAVRTTTNTEEEFIKLMNDKVIELGLKDTHFSNAIGMDYDNYSTMHDIAKILEYALKNEKFKEVFTTAKYNILSLELKGPLSRMNSDLVGGAKTGFTYAAMYCLASFSSKDNFNYIVVTAHADSYEHVMNDHVNIYNYYYNNYKYFDYNVNFDIDIKNGKEEVYNINYDTKLYLNNNYDKNKLIYKYDGIKLIDKTIKKGDKLGFLKIYYDNELLEEVNIYLDSTIEYKNYLYLCFIPIGVRVLILLIILMIKLKKDRQN